MAPRGKPGSGTRNTERMAPRALFNASTLMVIVLAFHHFFSWVALDDFYLYHFLCLFTWRYLRFLINLAAFWCYSPAPKPTGKPTYTPSKDVTVIVPTVDPEGKDFFECLKSCTDNHPAKIVVVAAGDELYNQALPKVRQLEQQYKSIQFVVDRTQVASKRFQVAQGLKHVNTDLTVTLDDHVFWGPNFLRAVLRPFEDPDVGVVGCNKRVRRVDGLNPWGRFWNMLGATYLMRHNFEIRATNAVDGGVFVVSGRSIAIRTAILRHPDFLPNYTNERFLFGMLGPLNPDDDNFVTRFVVTHGWKIKIQYTDESEMETTIGVEHPLHTKFLGQCKRWARTTWRSNMCSLVTDRTVWASQPYCVYSVYLTSFTNFALITDPLLVYLFTHSSFYTPTALTCLVSWIFFTKLPKIFPYFRRYPQDTWLLPFYILFAYYHSLIKLWALLTFWDCAWSGRRLDQIKVNTASTGQPAIASIRQRTTPSPPRITTNPYIQQHLATIESLRTRIASLQTLHNNHIAHTQLPLLTELQQLRQAFATLQQTQSDMRGNQAAIRTELQNVMEQADDVGAVYEEVVGGEDDIRTAVEGLRSAITGAEERWRVTGGGGSVSRVGGEGIPIPVGERRGGRSEGQDSLYSLYMSYL